MKKAKFHHGRLRIFFWCVGIALGIAQVWYTRNTTNPDGISYLDLGDAIWRHDWHMAVNGYWSPLYPWILGFFLKVLHPSGRWEYPVVHLVNFFIYVAALASFDFFLRALMNHVQISAPDAGAQSLAPLPEWAWWTLGFSLFIWLSLTTMSLYVITPDMCAAAFVFLDCGLLLQIRDGNTAWRPFALFGAMLGLGYIAKAVLFPLGFVFLGVALFSVGNLRKAIPRVLFSALVFFAIASPLIVVLSRAKHRLTFGDSGRLAYAACVDGVDEWYPGDGGKADCVTITVKGIDDRFPNARALRHPAKKIFNFPATYEFPGPVGGTHPFWYDPSYWQEGIEPHFNLKGELGALSESLHIYISLFLRPFGGLDVWLALISLFLWSRRPWLCLKSAARNWPLLIPALVAMGMYAVIYTESRYVSPFVLLLWLSLFGGVRLSALDGLKNQRINRGAGAIIIAVAIASFARHAVLHPIYYPQPYWKAAKALEEMGIRPGDKVAMISEEPFGEGGPFVARLAKVRIIAQVNQPNLFWRADADTQRQVIESIAKTGARAILAWRKPPGAGPETDWQKLDDTSYYAYLLTDKAHDHDNE